MLTGHPDRAAYELVFVADLAVELRAWPHGTWASPWRGCAGDRRRVIAAWQDGHVKGLQLGGLTGEEALALERPAMTYVRAQLGDRLGRQLARLYRQWRHPSRVTSLEGAFGPVVPSLMLGRWRRSDPPGIDRRCPWVTARCRCYGHAEGTAGEDQPLSSVAATVTS